jgi:hypothetical protein
MNAAAENETFVAAHDAAQARTGTMLHKGANKQSPEEKGEDHGIPN